MYNNLNLKSHLIRSKTKLGVIVSMFRTKSFIIYRNAVLINVIIY